MRAQVTGHLEQRLAVERETHARLTKELAKLDVKEERLLDLAADASLSTGKLRQRLNDIQVKRVGIQSQLERTEEHVRKETAMLLAYVDLLEHPEQFYAAATDEGKRKLLAAFYTHIWLDDDGTVTQPVAEQRDVVAYIRDTAHEAIGDTGQCEGNEKGAGPKSSASRAADLQVAPQVSCSNESNLVAGTGFEPVTSGL